MERRSTARNGAGLLIAALLLWNPAGAAPGDPLGPAFAISTQPERVQQLRGLDASGAGYRAFWIRTDTYAGSLLSRRFDALGNPLEGEVPLLPLGAWEIASAPDGRSVAVFVDHLLQHSIKAQRYAADGSPDGPAFFVTEPGTVFGNNDLGYRPRVAMNANGDFVIAWTQRKSIGKAGRDCSPGFGGPYNCLGSNIAKIMARPYLGGGTIPGEPVTVAASNLINATLLGYGGDTGPAVDNPAVALAPDGSYAVAWTTVTELASQLRNGELKVRHYPASGATTLARTVESTGVQAPAEITMDGMGNYTLLYMKHRLGTRNIMGLSLRRYSGDNANALGPAVQVVPQEQRYYWDRIGIKASASGNLVVAWTDGAGIYARRYGSDGSAQGGTITVAHSNYYRDLRLARSGSSFLVAWVEAPLANDQINNVMGRVYESP